MADDDDEEEVALFALASTYQGPSPITQSIVHIAYVQEESIVSAVLDELGIKAASEVPMAPTAAAATPAGAEAATAPAGGGAADTGMDEVIFDIYTQEFACSLQSRPNIVH